MIQGDGVCYFALPSLYVQGVKHRIDTTPVRPDKVLALVQERYGYIQEELASRDRSSDLVFARQLAMLTIYRRSRLSQKQTGKIFNRDHTTVIHSIDVMKNYMDTGYRKEEIDFFLTYDY